MFLRVQRSFFNIFITIHHLQFPFKCQHLRLVSGCTDGPEQYLVKICALQGYYAAYSGNSLPTFPDNLWVPSSVHLHGTHPLDSSRSDGQEIIRRLWNPNLTAAFTRNRHSILLASRRMYYTPSYHIHDQF